MSRIRITLTRSPIGNIETQKRTARALGLTRMHKSVIRPDNDSIRGMVRSIRHLVTVEAVEESDDAAS